MPKTCCSKIGGFIWIFVVGLAPDPRSAGRARAPPREPLVLHARVRVAVPSGEAGPTHRPGSWSRRSVAVGPLEDGDHHLRHVGQALVPGGDPSGRRAGARDEPDGRRGSGQGRADHPLAEQLHERLQGPPRAEAAQTAPKAANLPKDIAGWCSKIPAEEKGVYPIDQSDGGCDDGPQCPQGWPWKSQIAAIEIRDEDAISDSGVEIWNLLEARGINNVMLMGVHTNMCVLGRPFGLRQLVLHKQECPAGPRPDRHHVQLPQVALRQPLRGDEPDRRAHREVRRPDDHLDRPHRSARLQVQGRRPPLRRVLDRRGRVPDGEDAAGFRGSRNWSRWASAARWRSPTRSRRTTSRVSRPSTTPTCSS